MLTRPTRHRHRLAAALTAVAVGVLGLAIVPSAAGQTHAAHQPAKAAPADWPTYHGDAARTGRSATMPTAQGAPHILAKIRLDGKVYASPIVVQGRTFVATENNTVYAFGPKLKLGWKRHFGRPSPASERECGNIDPLGITGTPVYGAKYDAIYVAAQLGKPARHVLYALDRRTGRIKWDRSLDFGGVDRADMQQRGALTIAGQRVLVPFGGLAGDCGNYKGRLIGTYRNGKAGQAVYTVPTQRGGGMWAPPGPAVDVYGHAFVATGNGAAGVGDRFDYSDSVLRLEADTLRLQQFYAPYSWPTDNDAYLDLGSLGATLVAGHWILAVGKSGGGYVLDKTHLGGIGGALARTQVCQGAYGGSAVYGHYVYVPCADGLRALYISNAPGIKVRWKAPITVTGSPVLGGGRVWSLDPFSGILYGLSGATGRVLSQTMVGGTSRFATPAIYGNRMMIPTLDGLTVISTS